MQNFREEIDKVIQEMKSEKNGKIMSLQDELNNITTKYEKLKVSNHILKVLKDNSSKYHSYNS